MKALFFIVALFVSTLCVAAQPQQQATPTPTPAATLRLDIILEGPWLLYEDHHILDNMSVLVAIAPLPDGNSHAFHSPLIRTGDGHAIKSSGIYCLYFDTKCGRDGNRALNNDSYPTVAILKVYAKPTWKWTDLSSRAMILLLPMPDSYSNEEAWPMQFGSTFNDKGLGYKPYGDLDHSIGVQLHYANGPRRIDVTGCQLNHTKPESVSCVTPDAKHMLYNTGTLRVDMKAPDPDWLERLYDYCDFHVRYTYPQMISLVDGQNPDIQVIDPAIRIDENAKAAFDAGKWGCLFWDDQNPRRKGIHGFHSTSASDGSTLTELINRVEALLQGLAKYQGELSRYRDDNVSGFSYDDAFTEINKVAARIGDASVGLSDNLPKISQLTMIRGLLLQASNQISMITSRLEIEKRDHCRDNREHCNAPEAHIDEDVIVHLEDDLTELQHKIFFLVDDIPSKDGKDCRAPLMLVAQP